MGKALIAENKGDGLYRVRLQLDTLRAEGAIKTLEERIAALITKSQLTTTESAALVAYKNRLDMLKNNLPNDEELELWCVDLSDDLEGFVGTLEIAGERPRFGQAANMLIHANSLESEEGTATFQSERDGMIQPVLAVSAAAWFVNVCRFPGWQKWLARFRLGIITKKPTVDTANVKLDVALSSVRGYDVNQTETLQNVPISYMNCNGAVFEVDDRVVIEFINRDWETPKIIGFTDNPRACCICSFISKPVSDSAPDGWGSPFDPPPGTPGGPDPYVSFLPKSTIYEVNRGVTPLYGLLDWQGKNEILSWDHPIPNTGMRYLWDNFTWQDLRNIYYKGEMLVQAPGNIGGAGINGKNLVVVCWNYDAGQKKITYDFYQTEFKKEETQPAPAWTSLGSYTTPDTSAIEADLIIIIGSIVPTQACYFSENAGKAVCIVKFVDLYNNWTGTVKLTFHLSTTALTEVNEIYINGPDGNTNRFSVEAKYYANDFTCISESYIHTLPTNHIFLASDFSKNESSDLKLKYEENYWNKMEPIGYYYMEKTIGLQISLNDTALYHGNYNLKNPATSFSNFAITSGSFSIYSIDLREKSIFFETKDTKDTYTYSIGTPIWTFTLPSWYPNIPGERIETTELKFILDTQESIIKTNTVNLGGLSMGRITRNNLFNAFRTYLRNKLTQLGINERGLPPWVLCNYPPEYQEIVDNYLTLKVYPGGDYSNYALPRIGYNMGQYIDIKSSNSYQAAMLSKKLRFISFPYDTDNSTINMLTNSDPVALNQ